MPQQRHQTQSDDSMIYEIRIKGHLSADWKQWFDCLSLVETENGETILVCAVCDQPALHGLLRRIRDLGVLLISVVQINTDDSDD